MNAQVSNNDNVISSLDVIACIEELQIELDVMNETLAEAAASVEHATEVKEALEEELKEAQEALEEALEEKLKEAQEELEEAQEELKEAQEEKENWPYKWKFEALSDLASQGADFSGWTYGVTLINEFYWEEYVKELVKDIGDIPRDVPDYIVIDWQATAENLKADYSVISFDGTDYLVHD